MIFEGKLEPSSFLAIVVMNILAMILAIPSMINVLKPIMPGVKSKAVIAYMFWKSFEIVVCPALDAYALYASTQFNPDGKTKGMTHGEIEKELYNEEVYEDEYLPFVNKISF